MHILKPLPGTLPMPEHLLVDAVALWPMNESAGTIVNDLSGNRNTILWGGTPEWVAGKYGNAIYFGGDGSGDYLTTPPLPTDTYSIVTWLRCEETGTYSYLFDARIDAGVGYVYNNNSTSTISKSSGTCYINGVQTTSSYQNKWFQLVVSGISLTVPTGIRIARKADLRGDQSQEGPIDHILIYNRALTASEIALLYREPFCMFPENIMPEFGIAA